MKKIKRIYLVGHMGAGRTLLGKALADQLGWKFIDIYLGLERYMGRPLSDILGKQGEATILQYQADLLAYYQKEEKIIVTTDDTIVLNPDIRKLLSREYVIYSKVNTDVQLERMAESSFPPFPLLTEQDKRAFLNKLHSERDSLYEEIATFTIESISVEADVNSIMEALADEINQIMKMLADKI